MIELLIKRIVVKEEGQGLIEYGMVLGFVTIICVFVYNGTTGPLGSAISNIFETISMYITENWSL